MKANAKEALEDEHLSTLYEKHKVDFESAFVNLKGNLPSRDFYCVIKQLNRVSPWAII